MSELSRRGFFFGSAAIILTPGLLMPVKKIFIPKPLVGPLHYNFSDMSTMFQDAAGLIPVTKAGQSIALIKPVGGVGAAMTAYGGIFMVDEQVGYASFTQRL